MTIFICYKFCFLVKSISKQFTRKMKKFVLSIVIGLISLGNLNAQDEENYRSRNYKLNKHHSTLIKNKKHTVAEVKNEIGQSKENYLLRNSKFHKTTDNSSLFIRKDRLSQDYQSMNHKLKDKPTVGHGNSHLGKNLVKFITVLVTLSILMQQ